MSQFGSRRSILGTVIREYQPQDHANLERLMDTFGDELAGMDPLSRVIRADGFGRASTNRMVSQAGGSFGCLFVAVADGSVVGFAAGVLRDRPQEEIYEVIPFHDGEVIELYVVPDRRRQGVGTNLLRACEGWFLDHGCGAVHIEVFAPNTSAVEFYARHGYGPRDIHQIKVL